MTPHGISSQPTNAHPDDSETVLQSIESPDPPADLLRNLSLVRKFERSPAPSPPESEERDAWLQDQMKNSRTVPSENRKRGATEDIRQV